MNWLARISAMVVLGTTLGNALIRLILCWGLVTDGVDDPAEMKRAILASVPVGSSMVAVGRFLEREGFRQEEQGWFDGA